MFRKFIFSLAIALFVANAGAQERNPADEPALPAQPEYSDGTQPVDVTDEVSVPIPVPIPAPKHWLITGNYSYFDLWVPSKIGVTVGYKYSNTGIVEFDYMFGSLGTKWVGIDLGTVREQRISLLWRKFPSGRSFNWFGGINYNNLELTIGNSALATVNAVNSGEYSLLEVSTFGLTVGLGNRWQWNNGFVLSVDWVQINMPLITAKENSPFLDGTTDPDRRSEAEDLVRFVKNFPRFALARLQVGISF